MEKVVLEAIPSLSDKFTVNIGDINASSMSDLVDVSEDPVTLSGDVAELVSDLFS